ncbi:MAG: hypothetical protein INH41_00545 [Myxococcaceae bacterium]|jgi:hypothetical protein|nr:hypothetical protein [Myxococcaceae bacterium]MCA3010865.1 hypothetical protein [Myxococcaceae bacterium]
MARFDRFEKLERERPEGSTAEGPRAEAARFTAPETPAPGDDAPQAPALEAARQFALEGQPGGLQRFEADGANHLSLDTDPLMRLPVRRCAECQRDSGKFDRACLFCHASLETPAARALNLAILEAADAERAEEAARRSAERAAEVKALMESHVQAAPVDAPVNAAVTRRHLRVAFAVLQAILLVSVVALFLGASRRGVAAFVVVGLVTAAAALPPGLLRELYDVARRLGRGGGPAR